MKAASPYAFPRRSFVLGAGTAWRPIRMLRSSRPSTCSAWAQSRTYKLLSGWLVGRLGWDVIHGGRGVGRADHVAGVGANDGEREWRWRVLDTGDLEGLAESSSDGALQVWLVSTIVSDEQLVREEAEELRRRRVRPRGGKGEGPVPGRV